MTAPFAFVPVNVGAVARKLENGGEVTAAPPNTKTPSRLTPPTTNPAEPTDLQTLSDTLISILNSGSAAQAPTVSAGPAYITATNTGGSTVDWKKLAILAAVGFGAWWLWKKYGKKAAE